MPSAHSNEGEEEELLLDVLAMEEAEIDENQEKEDERLTEDCEEMEEELLPQSGANPH